MIKNINIGKLKVMVVGLDYPTVNYFVSPMDIAQSAALCYASDHKCSFVVITGMDWDDDLTPWPALGVPSNSAPFKGQASEFLTQLKEEVLPKVESCLIKVPEVRNLCGVSLSGLFATWAWMQDDTFDNIGSISGSFWYNDFIEWLRANVVSKKGYSYFSLGDKEGGRYGDPAFKDIQQQTREVLEIFKGAGIRTTFQQTHGNHFANPSARINYMLNSLMIEQRNYLSFSH